MSSDDICKIPQGEFLLLWTPTIVQRVVRTGENIACIQTMAVEEQVEVNWTALEALMELRRSQRVAAIKAEKQQSADPVLHKLAEEQEVYTHSSTCPMGWNPPKAFPCICIPGRRES